MRVTAPAAAERIAVLGDDSRYHLLVNGRYKCAEPWSRRRKPAPSALLHEENCSWWTPNGMLYRVNAPDREALKNGMHGSMRVRWVVLPTDRHVDPALVPVRQRCRTFRNWHDWPPYAGPCWGRSFTR
ncbi:hypothetical protein [Nonomuraea dietziae]|uniref:hypothetical protein n=1 Tax=Nonomuraea dietziae TaxID=65515 RepID=UPI00341934C9